MLTRKHPQGFAEKVSFNKSDSVSKVSCHQTAGGNCPGLELNRLHQSVCITKCLFELGTYHSEGSNTSLWPPRSNYSINITSMSTIFFLLNYPRYFKAPHSQTNRHTFCFYKNRYEYTLIKLSLSFSFRDCVTKQSIFM